MPTAMPISAGSSRHSTRRRVSTSGDHEYFTRQVRYGQTNTLCSVGAGSPGIDAGCMAQNGSDFTLMTSLNFSSAIAGENTEIQNVKLWRYGENV